MTSGLGPAPRFCIFVLGQETFKHRTADASENSRKQSFPCDISPGRWKGVWKPQN